MKQIEANIHNKKIRQIRNRENGIKESGNMYNLRSADKKKLQEVRKKIKREWTESNVEK